MYSNWNEGLNLHGLNYYLQIFRFSSVKKNKIFLVLKSNLKASGAEPIGDFKTRIGQRPS